MRYDCPDGLVEFVNCGHGAPVHVTPSGSRLLGDGNLIVGFIPGATCASVQYRLKPGERIVLTTDGITEAHNPQGVMFGEASFDAIVQLDDIEQILALVVRDRLNDRTGTLEVRLPLKSEPVTASTPATNPDPGQ